MDLWEFEASLVYISSSKTAKDTSKKILSKKEQSKARKEMKSSGSVQTNQCKYLIGSLRELYYCCLVEAGEGI